ncbi:hypothetical protein GCM10027289_12500 [Tsukamurella serpentis]
MTAALGGSAVLRNEFAKFRRLRLGAIAAVLLLGVTGLTAIGMVGGTSGEGVQAFTWALPLAGLGLAFPIVAPLLIAVLASRAVEIEHQGNGWMLNAGTGVGRGQLCRAKVTSAGALVAAGTVISSCAALVIGLFLGGTGRPPVGLWMAYTFSVVIINLVVLAAQVLIAARVDNQLIGLGTGIVGTVIALSAPAMPRALVHLTPWGYYSLVEPADYQGDAAVFLTPSYPSVVLLAVVALIGFHTITVRLDRKESAG